VGEWKRKIYVNPLNAKLNPTCHMLALLGAHHILYVSRIRVNWHCNVRRENCDKKEAEKI